LLLPWQTVRRASTARVPAFRETQFLLPTLVATLTRTVFSSQTDQDFARNSRRKCQTMSLLFLLKRIRVIRPTTFQPVSVCVTINRTYTQYLITHLDRLAIPCRQQIDPESRKASLPSAATLATNADILGENGPKEEQDRSKVTTKNELEDEAAQDESIDPAPFSFEPFQLKKMLDPKDLPALTALGGTDGIIRGLGTDPERGLTTTSSHTGEQPLQGAGQDNLNSEKQIDSTRFAVGHPYTGTINDRKRVFGENVIPTRISKTLPQFMFVALQDKILVCRCEPQYHSPSQHSSFRSCYHLQPWFLWLWVFSKLLVLLPEKIKSHLSTGWKLSPLSSLSQYL